MSTLAQRDGATPANGKSPEIGRRVATIAIVLWMTLPVAAFIFLTHSSQVASINQSIDVWVTPAPVTAAARSKVDLVVIHEEQARLYAPAWSGIVQALGVNPGETLSSGGVVAVIDGVTRLAYNSERPFSRTLTLGDTGLEVAALKSLLVSRGFPVDAGEQFTWVTLAAVQDFATSIGVRDGDEIEYFDPGWVVYLPAPSVLVDIETLNVGALAPSAGSEILIAVAPIGATRLIEHGSADNLADGADLNSVGRPLTGEPDFQLSIGNELLNLNEDYTGVDSAEFTKLERLMTPDGQVLVGFLTGVRASRGWVLPATALVIARDGDTCLIVRSGDRIHSVPVQVLANSGGRATVDAELSGLDSVLVSSAGPTPRSCT